MVITTHTPQILFGKVMHARLFPKKNAFRYGIYYLSLPLSQMQELPIAHNRFAALSFYDRDHGPCNGDDLESWARQILKEHDITTANGDITLMCMPRILGYVFNPVSFWICCDEQKRVRAVLCEVHNTFGERHTYICAHEDQQPITQIDVLTAQKIFHVSPFLEREGHYKFRFDIKDDQFSAWIDFYDAQKNKKLVTSLIGKHEPLNKKTTRKAFWTHPLVTFKAIALIHWQALKLLVKGIAYIPKPTQKKQRVSKTDNLTKM